MERKQSPALVPVKLTEAVARDFPTTEILVSFPDSWALIDSFKRGNQSLYVAGFPPSQERSRGGHFFGLSPEINRSLTTYRLYKLFAPWTTHLFQMSWNSYIGEGRLIGGGRPQVQLQPRGQAQVWTGETYGVAWEGYLFETEQEQDNWQETLRQFWQAVEIDMGVQTIFTQPHEPTFQEGYTDFLRQLGYGPDPHFERWWRKDRSDVT